MEKVLCKVEGVSSWLRRAWLYRGEAWYGWRDLNPARKKLVLFAPLMSVGDAAFDVGGKYSHIEWCSPAD